MSWIITSTYGLVDDPDAIAYLSAVQATDGQLLEPGVRQAVNDFVKGCKADGIWSAIKASCILAGARTLNGALVPLVGPAPTNFNFAAGDYNRKTGLVGNGSTKYLDSNRNNNADPQNSKHVSLYIAESTTVHNFGRIMAAGDSSAGDTAIATASVPGPTGFYVNINNSSAAAFGNQNNLGFLGLSRAESQNFLARSSGSNTGIARSSATPRSENIRLFGRPGEGTPRYVNARLAFYSIGEAVNLALLDARVTTLMNALAAAIP